MVSRHHLIAWSRLAGAEVIAIADPDAEAARRRAQEFGIGATFAGVEEMLERVQPDALDVAAPMGVHGAIVAAAARAGLPVLCQKPLAPTLAEARAIADAAEGRIRLAVHENWRFRPHYRAILQAIGEGAIGTPRQFAMQSLSAGMLTPAGGGTPPALARQPFMAGLERLIVWEMLIHHLDTLGFLFGPLEIEAASLQRLSPHVRGEDTALVTLRAGSARGTLFASQAVAGAPPRRGDDLLVIGDGGALRLDEAGIRINGADGRTRHLEIDFEADYQASYDAAIAQFAAALTGDGPFETPPEAHLAILAAAEAIYALGAGGRP